MIEDFYPSIYNIHKVMFILQFEVILCSPHSVVIEVLLLN